ncbi:hypothetical protein [Clostridium thermobutyricum]|uniref:hypothetical protein n=1 Tax=Clostridium thermobutyricum TaxID=29372 RepID=UPI0018A916CE|nr:hypothetical protein [Clostridium thermobutyricum]
MKIKSLLGILIVIIVGILIVIPRSYFVKSNIKEENATLSKTVQNLTNGPEYMNSFLRNTIEIQAISGDMGNTIEYTLRDLIAKDTAVSILNKDYTILENIKENLISLKNKNSEELSNLINKQIDNINKLENLNKTAIPNIQNFNIQNLEDLSKNIAFSFCEGEPNIGNKYKINLDSYNSVLAEKTYEYNFAKDYIS